jgi:hypothetical protein
MSPFDWAVANSSASHRRVGEHAKGDADKIRERFRVPEHRGAAVRAEMKFDLSPRVATAHVDLAWPLGEDLLFWEIGADATGRAGMALALRAMTRTHECRFAGRLSAQRTATTMRDPGHRQTSILALSPVDRALVSESVSSSAARETVNRPCIIASPSGRLPTTQQYSSEIPLGSLK